MQQDKMSGEEMKSYYLRLHREAIARNSQESLSAVIDISQNRWVNSFTDYAHRLGMKRAFKILTREFGPLDGRAVLDLGCGRGRWSKEYAGRGASVTGADISPEAISLVAREMPQHHFVCGDVADLGFPPESFDVVNSVTVLQHMPHEKQQLALSHAAQWTKPGGFLVLLENIGPINSLHVFPHLTGEWIRMAEAAGWKPLQSWGSNFEVPLRVVANIRGRFRENGVRTDKTSSDNRRGKNDRTTDLLSSHGVPSFL